MVPVTAPLTLRLRNLSTPTPLPHCRVARDRRRLQVESPPVVRMVLSATDDAGVAGERNVDLVGLVLDLHHCGTVSRNEVTGREGQLAQRPGLRRAEGEAATVDLLVEGLGVE